MNALDDLLADTRQVDRLASTAIGRGRAELGDAIRSLHVSGADTGSTGRPRRRIIALASAAGVAAAAAAVVVTLVSAPAHLGSTNEATGTGGTSPTASAHGPVRSGNTIELAGYRIALPANYKLGKADTNCTADLHLSADETKRLVTTPAPGCPLLVASVQRTLPAGVDKFTIGQGDHAGNIVASFVGYQDWTAGEAYLPVKLSDGTTVYVTIDTGSAKHFAVGDNLTTQLMELEKGLQVSPTSPFTGTPLDKPTVNCNAHCNK